MPLVNTKDLEARWKPLQDSERERASTLIQDAEALIASLGVDMQEVDAQMLIPIVCSMVRRVLDKGDSTSGLTSEQQTVGPFTQTWSFANPSGDMYLTKLEKRQLGIGRSRISMIRPRIGRDPHA